MTGLIQKSGFIKPERAAGYIRYIATREGVEVLPGPEGYMEYMATRPGSHGLFSSQPVDLDTVMEEVSQHTGTVWTLIYSLHREDAARLGYDNAASWRQLIKAHQVELANAMKIPPEQFRWCAAYHDEGEHPHIHMTVWSDDPAQGFLTPDGIKAMRSTLTNSIFQDELYSLYQRKDISYKELTAQARASMRELVRQMENTVCDSPVIEMRMLQLAHELKTVSGKKVYGYLKKPLKEQVDAIVDELAKVPAVAECYEVWNQLRDELESYYKDKPRQRLPLSQQKEFKAIKNMVIREANDLRLGILTFEDEGMRDESPDNSRFSDPNVSNEDKRAVIEMLEQRWEDDGSVSAAYQLGRVWRDGLGVPPDDKKAEEWFRRTAEDGHSGAQYALAKLLHQQGQVIEAVAWYEQAAEDGNQFAAYHDEGEHPHIHMTVWSDNPAQGLLTPDGIKVMRSTLTNSIFQDELYSLYQRKDISYKELTAQARASMRELVREMENTLCDSPVIETRMLQLSRELKTVSGKKVYGYLKKPLKEQVDAIVDELAKVPAVAECYEVWNNLRDELESYYKDKPRQRLPLSQQKEFKAIKNMVIREADDLRLGILTFEDEGMRDEPPDNSRFNDPSVSNEDKRSVIELLEQSWTNDGSVSAAYQLGRVWRDGLGVPPDDNKAEMWFRRAAEAGHSGAQYALAKLLHQQGQVNEAIPWYEQSAEGGNLFASYQLGKLYLAGEGVPKDVTRAVEYLIDAAEQNNPQAQYILGKLYLLGKDVDRDQKMAAQWFTVAADQGHQYAQFFLDHMEQDRDPSVLLCATRLLCSMAQIIRDTPPPAPPAGLRIDRKRFRQLMEKKIAMGHKPDDHEEQGYIGPTM